MATHQDLPTYEGITADLYAYFKRLVSIEDPSANVAQSTATIARALLSAMDKVPKKKGRAAELKEMTRKERVELAREKLNRKLKAV